MKELKLRVFGVSQLGQPLNKFIYSDEFNNYDNYTLSLAIFFDYIVDQKIVFDNYQLFTGIKDKNDIDIYEGDMIRFDYPIDNLEDDICEIQFKEGSFGYLENEDNEFTILSAWQKEIMEVIGNIYENNITELEKEIYQTLINAQNKLNKILESK